MIDIAVVAPFGGLFGQPQSGTIGQPFHPVNQPPPPIGQTPFGQPQQLPPGVPPVQPPQYEMMSAVSRPTSLAPGKQCVNQNGATERCDRFVVSVPKRVLVCVASVCLFA